VLDVERWAELRREHFVRGVSIKELMRRTGLARCQPSELSSARAARSSRSRSASRRSARSASVNFR